MGIIGGSNFLESEALKGFEKEAVEMEGHGPVQVWRKKGEGGKREVIFLQRHNQWNAERGEYGYRLPHLINHRANVNALKRLGCREVVLFCSTGSLRPSIAPGTVVLADDFVAPCCQTQYTAADASAHVAPRVDEGLRRALAGLVGRVLPGAPLERGGVYANTAGPRFETRAEVRALAGAYGGDVVGMTAAHEITLCAEQPVAAVAAVCCVDNMANGVSDSSIDYASFKAMVAQNRPNMEALLSALIDGGL